MTHLAVLAVVVGLGLTGAAQAQSRDSDGDVTSVIRPIWVNGDPLGPIYRFNTVNAPIEVAFNEADFDAGGAVSPTMLKADGQTYALESADGEIYLRDTANGALFVGVPVARVERSGRTLTANPKAFSLN